VLLPGHFGQTLGDMGPLWIDLERSMKGGGRLGKLPLSETRIAVGKGLERQAFWG
jgi:hypothetical protein